MGPQTARSLPVAPPLHRRVPRRGGRNGGAPTPLLEGVDEYVPANADASEVKQDASSVAVQDIPTPQIHIQQWDPELKVFTADLQEARKLVLHLFNYPAWVVQINGRVASTETQELTGQMIIPVDAGQNRVEIRFVRTWDRTLGGVISGVTLLLVLAIGVFSRKRSF